MTQRSGGEVNFICIMIKQLIGTYSQIRGKETPFALYSQPNGLMPRRKPEEKQFLTMYCKQLCYYKKKL
jgi:hypothetical protein